MPQKQNPDEKQIIGLVGVGLDNDDGHKRLTQSKHFILLGGSAETHERMQDTAIRFEEGLKRKRKSLRETTLEETLEMLHKAHES